MRANTLVICIILCDWIQEVFNSIFHGVVYIREVFKSAFEPQTQTAALATVVPDVGANHCFLIIHHPIMGSHRSHTCTGGQNSFHIITRRKTILPEQQVIPEGHNLT